MVYGYIRVSTEEQNLENQRKAILERFKVDEWVEEKRSGTVGWEKPRKHGHPTYRELEWLNSTAQK